MTVLSVDDLLDEGLVFFALLDHLRLASELEGNVLDVEGRRATTATAGDADDAASADAFTGLVRQTRSVGH